MILRTWFIEEIELDSGDIGQRQTVIEFDSTTGEWVRPDGRLEPGGEDDWDGVMADLSRIQGNKDVRWIVNPVALMDYCNNESLGRLRRERGKGDEHRIQPND